MRQSGEILGLKIITKAEQYYQITQKDWFDHGLLIMDVQDLNLWYRGEPYPFWIFEEGIRFYSPSLTHGSTVNENVFILTHQTSGEKKIINNVETGSQIISGEKNDIAVINQVFEQQNVYLPQSTGADRWMWSIMAPEVDLQLDMKMFEDIQNTFVIRFHLFIPSVGDEGRKQTFRLIFNQKEILITESIQKGWQTITFPVNTGSLEKMNELKFGIILNPDEIPVKIYLDHFDIEYEKPIELSNEFSSFSVSSIILNLPSASTKGTLVSFDRSQNIFAILPLNINESVSINHVSGTTYQWVPENEFKTPQNYELTKKNTFVGELSPINILIIAPQKLHQTLIPWINDRKEQGLESAMVSPEQIYDQLNSGFPSPDVLRNYIQGFYAQNPDHLKYLLLVGDYSYEAMDYQEYINSIPTFFIDSNQTGQTITDFPYSDLNEDLNPELAIGRIPASNSSQLQIYLDKLLNYEENLSPQSKSFSFLFDTSDPIFYQTGEQIRKSSSDSQVTLIGGDNNQAVLETFSHPFSYIFYFGHGSIDRWGQDEMLTTSQISDLPKNNFPPVIFSFSCLNGYFIHPQKTSLAENLLFHPEGGAISMYAPVDQAFMDEQLLLIQVLQDDLRSMSGLRIGDLLKSFIEKSLKTDPSIQHPGNTYIFFGDPTMVLP